MVSGAKRTWRWRRAVTLAAALAAGATLAPALRAQDDVAPTGDVVSIEQREGYVEAVRQIATGEERAGLAALAAIAAAHAEDPDLFLLHFNAACGHARLKELGPAFEQLGAAVRGGYGIHPGRLANLKADPDLAALRDDPRYAALVAQAESLSAALAASWNELTSAYEWLPPPAADPEEAKRPLPLLLVLHPYGEERAAFARQVFEAFCARHRFALLAPGGRQIIAPDKFAFFGAAGEFADRFRLEQRQVVIELESLKKRVAIDPQRIYVTGFGQGAGLGFAIAMRNPQWVRGAVLFDGGYAPATLKDWIEPAVKWGRRVALVHRDGDERYPLAPLESFAALLESQGLAVQLEAQETAAARTADAVAAVLAARLAWIDEVPFQRPAGDGR